MRDQPLIGKAHSFARKHHTEAYFRNHLLQVVEIIESCWLQDANLICAAYLHDIIEDTEVTYEQLLEEFNWDVANLVMEVTHDGQKDNYGYYFPRLHSKRGIILKFADRLSNLTRMDDPDWDEKRVAQYLKRSKFWKDGTDK